MRSLIFALVITAAATHGARATFDYASYDSVLRAFVDDGLVDYEGIKTDRRGLDRYLSQLAEVSGREFEMWSANERKAFWINAYNAITIDGILRSYPIESGGFPESRRFPRSSIQQIKNFWDTAFVPVMGKSITLNEIEHEILRREFDDPRIHFVLVCAAKGCPLLENRAFTPDDLDARLERASSDFISNPEKVRLDRKGNALYLSSIFDWYKSDFRSSEEAGSLFSGYDSEVRGVVEFVSGLMARADRAYVIEKRPRIEYLEYDWSLNEK